MKKLNIFYVLIVACAAMVFTSCKDEPVPTSDLTWYITEDFNLNRVNPQPLTVHVGQNITFMSKKSDGDVYVVWPGDEGFNYNKRNLSTAQAKDTVNNVVNKNKGISMYKNAQGEWINRYSYNYAKPGTYTVYLSVRNVFDNGLKYTEALDSAVITVIDTANALFGLDQAKYKFVPFYKYVNTVDGKTKTAIVQSSNIVTSGSTVTIKLPYEADVTNLEIFMKADKSTISVNEGTVTYNEEDKAYTWKGSLATSKTITVTSQGGVSATYTLSADIQPAKTGKQLLTYAIGSYPGTINGTTVTVDIPEGLNVSNVKPVFTVSEFASAYICNTIQYSKTTAADLTGGVTYTIKAQNESSQGYNIILNEIPTEMTALAVSSLNPVKTGEIDNTKTITVTVYDGTDVSKVIPTFTVSKFAKVYIGTKEIISGVTEVDFSEAVTLKVKVSNDIFVDYTVNVVFP